MKTKQQQIREILILLTAGFFLLTFHFLKISANWNIVLSLFFTVVIFRMYDNLIEAKNFEKKEPLESVKVYENGEYVKEYILPPKLIKTYYKEFGQQAAIENTQFILFLKRELSRDEIISYFADIDKREKDLYAAISKPLTPEYSALQDQTFHISYYVDNTLQVTTTVDGKPLTKKDIDSFREFISNVPKGQKIYNYHFDEWVKQRKMFAV